MHLGLMLAAAALSQGDPDPRPEPDLAAPTPVSEAAASGAIAYPVAFFAAGRPNNAFEMLPRVPGFTYNAGAAVRGFAGAAGNVLIDGERPSTKSITLDEVLKRVPASAVERIELIRGGAPGIDMQGMPMVVNVVRRKGALSTTAVSFAGKIWKIGWATPQADLELSRRYGPLRLDGALHANAGMSLDSGNGRLDLFTPSGALTQGGPLKVRRRNRTFSGNGAAELAHGADLWRLNLGGDNVHENGREMVPLSSAAGRILGEQTLTDQRVTRRAEAGGDYAHTFSDTLSARLVALQTLRSQTLASRSSALTGISTSGEAQKSGESILRATLAWRPSSTVTAETGGEAAFNFLDVDSSFTQNGVIVRLPNAQVRVEERRAEGFVTAFWRPSEKLSLEAGARVEASRISETGDTVLSRTFFFPKPRAVLTWTPMKDHQLRLRVEREVGQLDFRSFAASATLGGGEINAGNARLEPERDWLFEAAFERRFWGKGAVVVTLSHAEVQQVVDYVPIDARFDAPGNIGDGRREQVKVNLALPTDRLMIKGGLVTTEAIWRWSEVTDPVTGRPRPISQEIHFNGSMRFSQDVRRLRSTWGFNFNFGYPQTQYRISEIRRISYESFWFLTWDWKPRPDLTVHAEVQNATSRHFNRERILFTGPRSLGVVNAVEVRQDRYFPAFIVRVRKLL